MAETKVGKKSEGKKQTPDTVVVSNTKVPDTDDGVVINNDSYMPPK